MIKGIETRPNGATVVGKEVRPNGVVIVKKLGRSALGYFYYVEGSHDSPWEYLGNARRHTDGLTKVKESK